MSGGGPEPRLQASEVGALLRQTRISLGQSIGEVARDVRIRQTFLDAIETGRFDQLPGGAYTLGFVRTYAEHLGLEADEVVRRFKLETGTKAPAATLNFPSPLTENSVPKAAVLLIGAIIALIGYGIWYISSSRYLDVAELTLPLPEHLRQMLPGVHGSAATAGSTGSTEATLPKVEVAIESPADRRGTPPAAAPGATASAPAAPAESAPLAPSPPQAPPTPAEPSVPPAAASSTGSPQSAAPPVASPAAPLAPPVSSPGVTAPAGEGASRVVLRSRADTWVEVRDPATRAVVFSRLMRAGDTFAVPDRAGLLLRTGNAGGLEVLIDGTPGGMLGKPGTVRRNVALDAETLRADLTTAE